MQNAQQDIQIAGPLKVSDWLVARDVLLAKPTERLWKRAFGNFFRQRIATRYLNPIAKLRTNDDFSGEGFSIVSLQCALIEFFASTVEGKSYRMKRKGEPPLGPYEYGNSRNLFVTFLHGEPPFSLNFTEASAEEFYVNVRCGLLHEARTKNGWMIRAHGPSMVDPNKKVVYRNNLQKGLEKFVARYGDDLTLNVDRQRAFIRKFDSLCDL